MRKRWKILGGTGIASILAVVVVVGQSSVVKGDTSADTSPDATAQPPQTAPTGLGGYGPPSGPYALGPGSIPYEQLSASDKAAVDVIQENVETSQPPSYQADMQEAVDSLSQQVNAELSARNVGLVGTAEDGVVP